MIARAAESGLSFFITVMFAMFCESVYFQDFYRLSPNSSIWTQCGEQDLAFAAADHCVEQYRLEFFDLSKAMNCKESV